MNNFQISFEAIGTHWVIDCFNSVNDKKIIEKIIYERIEDFDRTYSRFRHDSIVWQMSENAGEYTLPSDSKRFMDYYESFERATNGKFTLLIGNTLTEAGYDSSYGLKPGKINKVPQSSSIYVWDYPILTIKKPYILDFGGLGKGYLIEIIADLLIQNQIQSFCIDAGGDIFCKNLAIPIRVGLENPRDFNQVIGVVELNNKSICASSGSRRRWDKYHHIMDPVTLDSPENILASWVIADEPILADGLSTSLFFTSAEKLLKYFNFEYLILYPDFSMHKSQNFSSELFTN